MGNAGLPQFLTYNTLYYYMIPVLGLLAAIC